jgi:hypothetical protein
MWWIRPKELALVKLTFKEIELLLSKSTPSNLLLLYISLLFPTFYELKTKSIAPELRNCVIDWLLVCVYLQ